ncbi:MAG: DUF6150 family protein [Bacteroidota bacterium]|nr:DUF6150 family protein [Bacteroidota bacterium]
MLLSPPAAVSSSYIPKETINQVNRESDFCRIYGSVFLTSDPKYKRMARYVVYLETEEAFANLVVFKEENKLFADKPGLWYPAPAHDFADHVLFVTTNRAFADFSVFYTKSRSFAGCRE